MEVCTVKLVIFSLSYYVVGTLGSEERTCTPIHRTQDRRATPPRGGYYSSGGTYGCISCHVTDHEVHIIWNKFATPKALEGGVDNVQITVNREELSKILPVKLVFVSDTQLDYTIQLKDDNIDITNILVFWFNKSNRTSLINIYDMNNKKVQVAVNTQHVTELTSYHLNFVQQAQSLTEMIQKHGYTFFTSLSYEAWAFKWDLLVGVNESCIPTSFPLLEDNLLTTFSTPKDESVSSQQTAYIVGGVVVALVFVCGGIVGLILWKRHKKNKHEDDQQKDNTSEYMDIDEENMYSYLPRYTTVDDMRKPKSKENNLRADIDLKTIEDEITQENVQLNSGYVCMNSATPPYVNNVVSGEGYTTLEKGLSENGSGEISGVHDNDNVFMNSASKPDVNDVKSRDSYTTLDKALSENESEKNLEKTHDSDYVCMDSASQPDVSDVKTRNGYTTLDKVVPEKSSENNLEKPQHDNDYVCMNSTSPPQAHDVKTKED